MALFRKKEAATAEVASTPEEKLVKAGRRGIAKIFEILKRTETKYSPYWPPLRRVEKPAPAKPALPFELPAEAAAKIAPPFEEKPSRMEAPLTSELGMRELAPPAAAAPREELLPSIPRAAAPAMAAVPRPTAYPLPERPRALEPLIRRAEAQAPAETGRAVDMESIMIEIRALRDQNRLILDRISILEERLRRLGY